MLSRLESIVNKLGEQIAGYVSEGNNTINSSVEATSVSNLQDESFEKRIEAPVISIDRLIGHSLWTSLATEVHALREALQSECTTSNDDHTQIYTASSSRTTANDLMFCRSASLPSSKIFVQPDRHIRQALLEAYCENVDRCFKILHLPSLRAFIEQRSCYLGKTQSAPGNIALKATIWFAAVNSLSERQRLSLFGTSKCEQIEYSRRNAEIALAEADILNTTDLATLQALALYIVRWLFYAI